MPEIAQRPKALLHDHLDGGLRPSTILDIADDIGHELPSTDETQLADWFVRGANTLDIHQYLATFEHTIAVMQSADHLHRVAREAVVDLADDRVAYAEVRFAPENHVHNGLSLDDVMEAVQDGFRAGMSAVSANDSTGATSNTGAANKNTAAPIVINTIVSAMRQADHSTEIAQLTVDWQARDSRVVAFDLAGPETGFPPTAHVEALDIARRNHLPITLHASEPPGLELISQALATGADRIGHGIRLYDDITANESGELVLGPLAQHILDQQVHLEMAPSCHVHVGAVPDISAHPVMKWHRAGFNVGVNTDNRLMSNVTVTSEMGQLVEHFDMTLAEMEALTVAAVHAGFGSWTERQHLIADVIRPGYAS